MYNRLAAAALSGTAKSVLLLGPRQTGKSTLLQGLQPDLAINFASPATFRDYVAHPERLEAELRAARPSVRVVLLDEVQKVPAILDAVQVLIDERPGRFRFLLSGSSARKLRRGMANMLPGRVRLAHLHPLVAKELADDFDLDRAMLHGTLPGIYAQPDAGERVLDLRSYVDSYLREEIQAEALVRDVGGYARMLELVAASSGHVLNLLALSREAGVRYETLRRYIGVLEDTLVGFVVPAWSGSDRASLVAHPKIFLFDTGVRNSLLRRDVQPPTATERGLLLEHLVAYEIQRRAGGSWHEARLFHYRTKHGAEVDFVLEVGREVWAIEVKASRDADAFRPAGMNSLSERLPKLARRIVVFLGERAQRRGDIELLPFDQFADLLPN